MLRTITFCVSFLTTNLAVAQNYTVTDIANFGGIGSRGVAVNAAGQVTGYASYTGDGKSSKRASQLKKMLKIKS